LRPIIRIEVTDSGYLYCCNKHKILGEKMNKKIILSLVSSFLMMSVLLLNLANAAPKVPSAAEIKAKQEKKYAAELVRVKKMSAAKNAADAIKLGFPYLLVHYAGRSRTLLLPGIEQKDHNNARAKCPVLVLDGLGDTIYGNNHMAYRKAMTAYAAKFNKITYKACAR
jgi:hypothetical protein